MPLRDIKILDFSRVLSGPFATQQLVDLGASVIKLEHPVHGDDTRKFGPPFIEGESTYFMSINRGKKSVAIDLKTEKGRDLALQLAAKCDVVVENFRPGTAKRLGLGPDQIRIVNPNVITCSISGYGGRGDPDYSTRPGYDAIIQAASGIMSLTGTVEGPASKVGVAISDMVAGLYAAQGILAALLKRATDKDKPEPQHIEISMQDAIVSFLSYQAGAYFATNKSPARMGDAHSSICPYETLPCADGPFVFAVGNDAQFERFTKLLQMPDLAQDERFQTNAARVQNRHELLERIGPELKKKTCKTWDKLLVEHNIPGGPVLDVAQALEHPQIHARGSILIHDHPSCGPMKTVASPVCINNDRRTQIPAPPLLGQHSKTVLIDELGLSEEAFEALVKNKIIG
jgi:crotonobetainyl-CoA:carnitine CoA-transferase CaiB-like acyl-CoA transferase